MGLFGWFSGIVKWLFRTLKTFTKDARIEGRIGHTQEDLRREILDSQIDTQRTIKEDRAALDITEDILATNTIADKKTKELKAEVDFFLQHGNEAHIVQNSQEEFTEILGFLTRLIAEWKKTEKHVEKETTRAEQNVEAHKKIKQDLKHETRFITQETRVLKKIRKKPELHPKEKLKILLRRRVLFNELAASNQEEIEVLTFSKARLEALLTRIRNHIEDAGRLEQAAHIKSWSNFSKYLERLDSFFYDDDKKLVLDTRVLLKSEGHRMQEFEAKVKEDAHKLATLALLQKEYDSFLIQEERDLQKGETNVPEAKLAS